MIIFEDEHIMVLHKQADSPYSLALFNTRDIRANGRTFWGYPLYERYGLDCFGFCAKKPNWYPVASMEKAHAAITGRMTKPVIGYGHSMGGYACVKYSKLFGFVGAVASGGQISIDPVEPIKDTRNTGHFNPALHMHMRIVSQDLKGRIILVYDPKDPGDREHAELIAALDPAIERLLTPYLGHRAVFAMRPKTVLLPLFDTILNNTSLAPVASALARERKLHLQYIIYLSRAALVHSKPRIALRILERIKGDIKPDLQDQLDMVRGRALVATGHKGQGIEMLEQLLRRNPENQNWAKLLYRLKRASA